MSPFEGFNQHLAVSCNSLPLYEGAMTFSPTKAILVQVQGHSLSPVVR